MSFFIVLANRFTKIIGNIVKGFGYLFHFFFPKKRFTIPKQSSPLIQREQRGHIPKILWQTNYTNVVSLPVYINYLFNRLMSFDYEYRYASNDDILDLFEKNASKDILKAYKRLNDGAAKADFWRLFVLHHIGGVYLDIDANFVWPLSSQIKNNEKEIFLRNKEHFTNYFMASEKENPIINKAINIVVDNILNEKNTATVYALTGPEVINNAIGDSKVTSRFYRYVCIQGAFTNEYFHYIDKKQGKWTHTKQEDIMTKENTST